MNLVDRNTIILRPKQPFVDWVNSLLDDDSPPVTLDYLGRGERTVYLVPEMWDMQETLAYVEPNKPILFENELEAWSEDEDLWPPVRNTEVFDQWFSIEFHSMVYDMVPMPVLKEADDEGRMEARHSLAASLQRLNNAFFPDYEDEGDVELRLAVQVLADYRDLVGEPFGECELMLTCVELGVRYAHKFPRVPAKFYETLRVIFVDFGRLLRELPGFFEQTDYHNRLRRLRQQATGVEASFGRSLIKSINGLLEDMGKG